jgi:hypothetical protein
VPVWSRDARWFDWREKAEIWRARIGGGTQSLSSDLPEDRLLQDAGYPPVCVECARVLFHCGYDSNIAVEAFKRVIDRQKGLLQ